MKSWSEIVLPKELRAVEVNPRKEPSKKILCQECGKRSAVLCRDCKVRPVRKGEVLCGGCFCDDIWRRLGSESMCIGYIRNSDPRNDPPPRCLSCL